VWREGRLEAKAKIWRLCGKGYYSNIPCVWHGSFVMKYNFDVATGRQQVPLQDVKRQE
jgi:hypothetical protein